MTHKSLHVLVRSRMKQLELVPYQLAKQLEGTVSKQTVYNFVASGKVIKSDTLLHILDALDLSIVNTKRT